MKIILDDYINIAKVSGEKQRCSFCGDKLNKGTHAISIRKETDASTYNVWIHISCVDEFVKVLKQGKDQNKNRLVAEEL